MSETENWMDSFRTQKRENVYVLTVTIIEQNKKEQIVKEVVDCPRGEAGAWYAGNLLFRLANEKLRGTEFETIAWEDSRMFDHESDKDYAYVKMKGLQKRVIAEMKWYQELPKEYGAVK
ncbi:MAG: hypothetical protein NC417_01805 [Candidatus Gastranaerophilales bacterium]|nr:hypothetical protein [Candidatus Gastranaerophilales bacterium]